MNSLRYKLTLAYSVLGVIGMILALAFFYSASTTSVYASAQARAISLADEIAYTLEILAGQNDIFSMQRLVEKSSTLQDVVQIFVVDTQQIILAHTDKHKVGSAADSELLKQAILNSQRISREENQHIVSIRPLHGKTYSQKYQDVSGALWVEIDISEIISQLQQTFGLVTLISTGILTLFFIGQYFVVKRIVIDRLRQVEAGIKQYMEEGRPNQLEVNTTLRSEDEINTLVRTFNYLITSLQHSQDNIKAERDFAILVMDSMGQGLTITNADGQYEYVNPAFSSMLGIPSEQLLGRRFFDFTHPDDLEKNVQAWEQRQTGTSASFELRLLASDGSSVHVLISSVPRFQNGAFIGSIAVITNISQRAFLEQMKTDFINRASHELRTPLTTAILMADLLGDHLPIDESDQYLGILKHELDRQRLLLNDLLVVGRLESRKYEVHLAPTRFDEVMDECIASVAPQAEDRGMIIDSTLAPDLPSLLTDRQGLLQIFINLLSNAVKFSKPGGKIIVTVSKKENFIVSAIQDNGIGIPARDLPHITSRFFRAKNATEMEIPGTGIGLFIVQEILEALGGKLEIGSIENNGTTITVSLPII